MTPRKEWFINMEELSNGKVIMANNSQSEVKYIASIKFTNPDGTTYILHEVRYMSPSSVLEFSVLKELWTSAMPSFEGLRRLRCIACVHLSEGKLEPRAKRGIFTRYPDGVTSHVFYIIGSQ